MRAGPARASPVRGLGAAALLGLTQYSQWGLSSMGISWGKSRVRGARGVCAGAFCEGPWRWCSTWLDSVLTVGPLFHGHLLGQEQGPRSARGLRGRVLRGALALLLYLA
ncbi:hypothetical protein O0L34_g18358 [Tuta absoluta]|nr:hypothetical protein O0L34_g18358 [Tuta absoluta]